jgi:hypothetical protein
LIAKLLRVHAAAVLEGRAASSLPQPMQAYIPPPTPIRESTQTLFCLRSVRWIDDQGQQKFVGQYRDAAVPVRLVGHALKSGACVPVTDPRRRELQSQGGTMQHPDGALDLDEPERPGPAIYLSPPQLQVIDRGPPIPMRVSVPRG